MTKDSASKPKGEKKRIKSVPKFRKAPNAPRRFKSAFIFYSQSRHPVIGAELRSNGDTVTAAEVAKKVSKEWRSLGPEEKTFWEAKATEDKKRYNMENSIYTGPHKVPVSKRAKKDPNAPKRPMSAFLAYSKDMRSSVRSENPNLSNTDISKALAKKWKTISNDVRQRYQKIVEEQMRIYNDKAQAYRDEKKQEEDQQRKQREEMAMKLVDLGVTTVPYKQCDYDNLSYAHTSPYPDLAPKEAQPVHENMERNSSNDSQLIHYAYNPEHWGRPFASGCDPEYNTSYWSHGYLNQGYIHCHDAWHHHRQNKTNINYNEHYYHYHGNESFHGFQGHMRNYDTSPYNCMSNHVSHSQAEHHHHEVLKKKM